ncbi:MAG TPA: hypothetical protein VNE42_10425 [Acidimicrobiales bacterium]|nr:hypothetical protein [Acidimicrobiales bacterium]
MPHQHWQTEPEEHDFPAAMNYLSLIIGDDVANDVVSELRIKPTVVYMAKDLLRASRLSLLGKDNKHVAGDLRKVEKGEHLSPVLLVRGEAITNMPLVVADGYHRICASYWIDENADIPCRLATWPR